jgi:hypothetical protein
MAFHTSYPDAARRNLSAADALSRGDRAQRTVAGYLYGLAPECAIKQLGTRSGSLTVRRDANGIDNPLMAHFPDLKTLLRDHLRGRAKANLRRFIDNDRFMHHWDIRQRYARDGDVDDRWIVEWKEQAHDVVGLMNAYD